MFKAVFRLYVKCVCVCVCVCWLRKPSERGREVNRQCAGQDSREFIVRQTHGSYE